MRIALSFILSLVLITNTSQAAPNVRTGALPSWLYAVHPDLDKKPIQRDISDGFYYELLEEQTSLPAKTEYTHYIKHINNETGVQNASEVSVTFSPQFQQVIFHRIVIHRNGAALDQLQADQIKVVQEETNADEFEYNGLKRAFITLKGIRKNDRIEVAYSVVGFNPVFGNKYSDEYSFNSSTAVCNYYKAIITTPSRTLHILSKDKTPAPKESLQGSTLVYFWDNPPYSNNSTTYISEYTGWQDVVGWGLTTFNNYHYSLPAGLLKKIAGWRAIAKGDKDLFANLAARFVQNDVRYLGLEIGANTHRPHAPAEVFSQLYGDCKDKALLLTIILQQEGIPAYVALVSTVIRNQLVNAGPSPAVFDHAIVGIHRSDSSYIFVDPTIADQRGELTSLFVPAYGYALLLKDGQRRLQPVTPGHIYDFTIIENLVAKMDDTARYTINSVYTGGAADEQRHTFAESSIKDIEESYREYYAATFDGIQKGSDISYSDDSIKNEFKVTETYAIPQLWQTGGKGTKSFDYYARLVRQFLPDPSDAADNEPIRLTYPRNVHFTLNLELPESNDIEWTPVHIKNDAYQFDFVTATNGAHVTLYYTLRTFRNEIAAAAVQQYKADYARMDEAISFQISVHDDPPGTTAPKPGREPTGSLSLPAVGNTRACWPAIWLTFFFSLFFSRLFVWLNRRSEETLYSPGSGYPLGGWLLLLGASLVVGIGFNLYNFLSSNYYSDNNWAAYGNAGGRALQYLYLGRMAIHLSCLAVGGATLLWFLRRRDIFPRMFIWQVGILLSGQLFLILLYHQIPIPSGLDTYKEDLMFGLVRNCVLGFIWVYYIIRSDQVKSTFLEPYAY